MRAAVITAGSKTSESVAGEVATASPPTPPAGSGARVARAVGVALLAAIGVVAVDVPGVVWTHSTPR